MRTAILILMLQTAAFASCKDGYVPTDVEGVCQASDVTNAVKPSDELPPSDKMPSWQREGVTVVDAPNLEAQDRKDDDEKVAADKEGKSKAGLK